MRFALAAGLLALAGCSAREAQLGEGLSGFETDNTIEADQPVCEEGI